MLVFTFDDLSSKDKAAKEAVKQFKKAGATVAQVDVRGNAKKTSGFAYRELFLTFTDSQIITMRIKESGDIYQVLLNKKIVPIRNQDDHTKAIKEMADMMARGRAAFQKRQAIKKVVMPSSIKTAAPKLEVALSERVQMLRSKVEQARTTLAELTA
jgi:hypothetical protein